MEKQPVTKLKGGKKIIWVPDHNWELKLKAMGVKFEVKRFAIKNLDMKASISNPARDHPFNKERAEVMAIAYQTQDTELDYLLVQKDVVGGGVHRTSAIEMAGGDDIVAYVVSDVSEPMWYDLVFLHNGGVGQGNTPDAMLNRAVHSHRRNNRSLAETAQLFSVPVSKLKAAIDDQDLQMMLAGPKYSVENTHQLSRVMLEVLRTVVNKHASAPVITHLATAFIGSKVSKKEAVEVRRAMFEADTDETRIAAIDLAISPYLKATGSRQRRAQPPADDDATKWRLFVSELSRFEGVLDGIKESDLRVHLPYKTDEQKADVVASCKRMECLRQKLNGVIKKTTNVDRDNR